jgi:hypothetical protein
MTVAASKQNYNKMTLPELFEYIMERDDIDDFRDMFQHIHNWSHNTDFTYQSITDPERHKVKEYIIRYIEDTEDED